MENRQKYPINQSQLYQLRSKKKMAEMLQFDFGCLDQILADSNYHVFLNAKGRWIQHPLSELRSIHDRLQRLLKRIRLPDYVHSQKNRSYVTNAVAHSGTVPFVKTDISKFYPSTSFSAVFHLFRHIFRCSEDVAWHLARLCCYQGKHLPTGSPISGIVAFLAHQPMFDQIAQIAVERSCVFTVFVDDLGISGLKASKSLLYQIRGIIRSHGLNTKDEKSKVYGSGRPKKITGVVITSDGPRVPNCRLLKIHRLRNKIQALDPNKERDRLELSLRGSLQETSQIHKASWASANNKG